MKSIIAGVLAAMILVAAQVAPAASEEYPELNLRFGHFVPANFPGSSIDQWWADEVEKRSGGKIKVEIFWAESIGKAKELLDLVSSGAIDLAATSPSYFPSKLPLTGATNALMYQFENNEEAVRVTAALTANSEPILAELKRNNIYPIFFHSLNGYRPFCTEPIETIEGFKGKKMRAWGEYVPIMWDSLGATPVNVLTNELYESLQRGSLDCAFWPHDLVYSAKLYEVAKYAFPEHFGAIPTWPIWVNWEVWHNEWPESVRKLLTEVGLEAMERDIELIAGAEAKAINKMVEEHGVTLVDFKDSGKLQETVPDLLKVWVEKQTERGIGDDARAVSKQWTEKRDRLRAEKN